ncbi:DNA-binding response regulator [Alteromonas sediminis]|uniref:DNA-binding response regulator n=1 Tax=Alteromonas sediminis TaxID=2259342 RepID=A0A3N5ZAH7_9ALTE|nr:LytTR family DNA-binding domain-containing protein [Alteromonas sediminis]RPJ66468.1 DNA-binding response regulator [Alteromonas sediminis]
MHKVMITDDEPLAREAIKLLLQEQTDVAEIIEAKDGNDALQQYQTHAPDIVFLDIQMPGITGIELAEQLQKECVVIFVTAYDQYAITAFELNAIDYLLKPFNNKRFYQALDKARNKIKEREVADYKQVGQLIRHMMDEQDRHYKSRLVIRDPGRIRLIDVDQINFILGAGNYAEIHTFDGNMVLHRETLSTLESQLDPNIFVRIHRSSIVRRSSVSELHPNEKGDYAVLLKTGESLTLSRRNKHKLAELMN